MDMNPFVGFFDNCMFTIVIILTTLVQIATVEFGAKFTKTFKLNMDQNLICIGFGLGSLIWGFILKQTPLDWWKLSCLDFDCSEEELAEHNEVDEDGERKNPLRSETFKKSMAKSASQKKREAEIM